MFDPSARQAKSVERKALPPLLDEFRTALEEEIDAASRNSASSAIPLVDGRLTGRVAQAFQYTFKLDTLLNTPGDSPGELVIPNKPRIPVTIVSIDGLRIIVSVDEYLDNFVPKARLETNLSYLMKKLVLRIEAKAGSTNPAADRMLGNARVSGVPISNYDSGSDGRGLNDGQLSAVNSSIGRDFTVIWGPPGTGKTRTIGEIAISLFRRNRSVLIVSHTNTAVDQAILKVAEIIGIGHHLQDGAVVRVGGYQLKA